MQCVGLKYGKGGRLKKMEVLPKSHLSAFICMQERFLIKCIIMIDSYSIGILCGATIQPGTGRWVSSPFSFFKLERHNGSESLSR